MSEHQATRTLVKSPPELWAECSDARSLARHLGDAVGEIRIRRLEPETTVAWEGERVSGTVRLEPSGWGTKVTLTADTEAPEGAPAPVAEPAPQPEPVAPAEAPPMSVAPPEPPPAPAHTGFVARFRRWWKPEPVAATEPVAARVPPAPPVAEQPAPARAPEPPEPSAPPVPAKNRVDLTAALDSLGKAHHRPFSRA